jgi:hypothetical protein
LTAFISAEQEALQQVIPGLKLLQGMHVYIAVWSFYYYCSYTHILEMKLLVVAANTAVAMLRPVRFIAAATFYIMDKVTIESL